MPNGTDYIPPPGAPVAPPWQGLDTTTFSGTTAVRPPAQYEAAEQFRQQLNAMRFREGQQQQAINAWLAYQRIRAYEAEMAKSGDQMKAFSASAAFMPPNTVPGIIRETRPVPQFEAVNLPGLPPGVRSGLRGERFQFAPQSYEMEVTPTGAKITRGKPPTPAGEPTTAFKTQLQQQLHNYDDAMGLLTHIEQNMNASDFGVRGAGKDLWAKVGGQLGVNIDPASLDVRQSLKLLRSSLYKSLRSDSNITDAERKQIESMLPSESLLESPARAVAALSSVKRELTARSQSAAKELGVEPPSWAKQKQNYAQRVKAAYKAGKMTEADAIKAISNFQATGQESPVP